MKKITIVGILSCSFMLALLLAGCGKSEKEQIADCTKNQKQILIALISYANDHQQKLPQDLSQLTGGEYALPPETLVCPAAQGGTVCSYLILPGADLRNGDANLPVICCKAHPGRTVVGYADGHVETIAGALPSPDKVTSPAAAAEDAAKKEKIANLRGQCMTALMQFKVAVGKAGFGTRPALRRFVLEVKSPLSGDDEAVWREFRKKVAKAGDDDEIIRSCSKSEFELLSKLLVLVQEYEMVAGK